MAKIEAGLAKVKGIESWFVIGGNDFTTQTASSNVATLVVVTTPWDQRKSKDLQLSAILARAQQVGATVPEAFTSVFGLPPIIGLSNTGGFQFMLEDRAGGEVAQLSQVGDALVDAARKRPRDRQRREHVSRECAVVQHRHEFGQARKPWACR